LGEKLMKKYWHGCFLLMLVGFAVWSGRVTAEDFRILYHEPLQFLLSDSTMEQQSSGVPATEAVPAEEGGRMLSFMAYGQQFTLHLQPNDRVIAQLPAEQKDVLRTTVQLYRGTLAEVEGSWVRVAHIGGQWSGVIWDGVELYIIDTSDEVAPFLDHGLAYATPYTLIYRLSDTANTPGVCAVDPTASPVHKYRILLEELQESVPALPAATKQLDVAIVADVAFIQSQSNAEATAVARMNVVDGIYSEQVGVRINVVEIRLLQQDGGLTSTDPITLLNQFGALASSSTFTNPGLAHLFTGRNLNGSVVGIAYLGSLCSARYGVGLSEASHSGTIGALIVAHEMGHNFGAPHDNQAGSACASTPGSFLMNPSLNGSDTFSQCSLDQIRPYVQNARCIGNITDPGPTPSPNPGGTILFSATFDTDNSGFTYRDDVFNTTQPAYARGSFHPTGGFSGGGLQVVLGGIDDADIQRMSGGWQRAFTLATPRAVTVSLRYRLVLTADYESNEWSEVRLAVDGVLVGTNGNNFIARLTGNGNGGSAQSTGWVQAPVKLDTLAAGTHVLTLGAFTNRKTTATERTTLRLDDIVVQTTSP
jgi:hypothetical protein